MRKVLLGVLFCLIFVNILPETFAEPANRQGVIKTKSGVNLRSKPSTDSVKIGKLLNAASVQILDETGPSETIEDITANWYYVTDGKVSGWCFGGFIDENNKVNNDNNAITASNPSPILAPAKIIVDNDSEAKDVTVESTGTGVTKIEAMNNAWSEAIKEAVGMRLKSKDTVIDDKLTEEITSYNRGRVNSYQVLKEENNDGIWSIQIKAIVEKDSLKPLKSSLKTTTIATREEIDAIRKICNESNNLDKLLDEFTIPWNSIKDCLDYKAVYKVIDNKLICAHLLRMNNKYDDLFLSEINKQLKKMATKIEEGAFSSNSIKEQIKKIDDFWKDGYKNIFDEIIIMRGDAFRMNPNYHIWWSNLIRPTGLNVCCVSKDYHFVNYTINLKNERKDLLMILNEKLKEKKYEISFCCKAVIGGKEEIFNTPYKNIRFGGFEEQGVFVFCHHLKIEQLPSSWEPFCVYIQKIDISAELAAKIESMDFSYVIQEDF